MVPGQIGQTGLNALLHVVVAPSNEVVNVITPPQPMVASNAPAYAKRQRNAAKNLAQVGWNNKREHSVYRFG